MSIFLITLYCIFYGVCRIFIHSHVLPLNPCVIVGLNHRNLNISIEKSDFVLLDNSTDYIADYQNSTSLLDFDTVKHVDGKVFREMNIPNINSTLGHYLGPFQEDLNKSTSLDTHFVSTNRFQVENSTIHHFHSSSKEPKQETNITFFPWNDGTHYGNVCNKLLSLFSSFKGPIIVNSGKYGGLGHKFVSLYYSVLYALILRRPLYIDWDPIYWNSMNSCFQPLQYKGDKTRLLKCSKLAKCFPTRSVYSLSKRDVILYDERLHGGDLFSAQTLKLINQYHLTDTKLSWREVNRLIVRLMTNPTSDTIDTILSKQSYFGRSSSLLGVHIRCGGSLADSRERKVSISRDQLKKIPPIIKSASKQLGTDVIIYLSTDSSYAERVLKKSLPKGRVVTFSDYIRGHTSGDKASEDTIKRALMDMYLIAQAESIIFTQKSGFSEICVSLSQAHSKFMIQSLL